MDELKETISEEQIQDSLRLREEMEQRNKKLDLYEEKAKLARLINETAENDANYLLRVLEQSQFEHVDVIAEIDQFLYRLQLLKADKYVINEQIIDIQTELFDYFEWYEEESRYMVDTYCGIDAPYFWSEEKEMLEKVAYKFGFYELYVRFVKWSLTNSPEELELFLQVLNDEFIEGFLCPVDRDEYWEFNYKQFDSLAVDDRLKTWVIYVMRFYDVYRDYIQKYMDNTSGSIASQNLFSSEIWAKDHIFDKIRIIEELAPDDPWFMKVVYEHPEQKMELWAQLLAGKNFAEPYYRDDIDEDDHFENTLDFSSPFEIPEELRFVIELRRGTELHKEYWRKCKPNIEEYFLLTRNLDDKEVYETGKCAYLELMQNMEAINISKWILKALAKELDDYNVLYKALAKVQEKLVAIIYGDTIEFEEQSITEDASTDIEQYKKQCILEITSNLIGFIASQDVEQLMQCKNDILPLYSTITPWLYETMEQNICRITEKIKYAVSKEDHFGKIYEKIWNQFHINFSDDIINTLSTAEWLYEKYIVTAEQVEGYDYSFISILYYQVLENASNILLYKPYIDKVKNEITIDNIKEYFGSANCVKTYTDKRTKQKCFSIKESLELGPISFFLAEAKKRESHIRQFLEKKYDCIQIDRLVNIGKEIGEASGRRNNAAHPGIISYDTAVEDKIVVFDSLCSYEEVKGLHDLFVRLITSLGLN